MEEIYAFPGPAADIKLTPMDQTAANLYSRRVFCFSLPSCDHQNAIQILRTAIQATVNQIPVLAMQAAPAPQGSQLGSAQLLHGGKAYLIVKDFTHKMSHAQLKASGFSSDLLDPNDLCPVPPYKEVTEPIYLCKIQANLIEDGLLLVFGIHHFAADGTAISTIIRLLASECRVAQGLAPNFQLSPDANDRSPLLKGVDGEPDVSKLVGYTIHESIPPMPTWAMPDGRPVSTVLFHISPSSMAELKAVASEPPTTDLDSLQEVPYITSHDAVSALIWSSIFCARCKLGFFSAVSQDQNSVPNGNTTTDGTNTIATLATPIDIRSTASPPLPSSYIGNALLHSSPHLPLSALTSPSRLPLAARCIRSSLRSIDADRIRTMTSIAATLPHIKHLEISCCRDIWKHDFYLTSYRKFAPHKLDWGKGLGVFEAFRLPRGGVGAGCGVVMPEGKGGAWAVCLSMHTEVMEVFREDGLVRRFMREVEVEVENA